MIMLPARQPSDDLAESKQPENKQPESKQSESPSRSRLVQRDRDSKQPENNSNPRGASRQDWKEIHDEPLERGPKWLTHAEVKKLVRGHYVDHRDNDGKWTLAMVVMKSNNDVFLHYEEQNL